MDASAAGGVVRGGIGGGFGGAGVEVRAGLAFGRAAPAGGLDKPGTAHGGRFAAGFAGLAGRATGGCEVARRHQRFACSADFRARGEGILAYQRAGALRQKFGAAANGSRPAEKSSRALREFWPPIFSTARVSKSVALFAPCAARWPTDCSIRGGIISGRRFISSCRPTPPTPGWRWGRRMPRRWRNGSARWARRTLALGLPEEDEALRLMWTLALDWKAPLTESVEEPFLRAGTFHIFAVDGLRIGLLAGIGIGLLRALRMPRAVCGLLVIPVIWFYAGLTGWPASAVRAAIMMSIVIGGWAAKRPGDLTNSLFAAALVILVWDPQQLFQAGFQLSFLVVLCIGLLALPMRRMLHARLFPPDELVPDEARPAWRVWVEGLRRRGIDMFVMSLAAFLGGLPLAAYYFHLVHPGGSAGEHGGRAADGAGVDELHGKPADRRLVAGAGGLVQSFRLVLDEVHHCRQPMVRALAGGQLVCGRAAADDVRVVLRGAAGRFHRLDFSRPAQAAGVGRPGSPQRRSGSRTGSGNAARRGWMCWPCAGRRRCSRAVPGRTGTCWRIAATRRRRKGLSSRFSTPKGSTGWMAFV